MATIVDPGYPNIANLLRAQGPDGRVALQMASVLAKMCPLYEDLPFVEGNQEGGHKVFADLALPPVTKRLINKGVKDSKGRTENWVEPCAMLEKHATVDTRMASGEALMRLRAHERRRTIESFKQVVEESFWYGSTFVNQDDIHGLTARYNAVSGSRTSSYLLKKGSHAGANGRSIWVLGLDRTKLHAIVPKGKPIGLRQRDLGEQWAYDSSGGKFRALQDIFEMDFGLAVPDWRYAVRVMWDPDDSTNFADTAKGLYLALIEAVNQIQDLNAEMTRIYMDRVSLTKLETQLIANDANAYSQVMELDSGFGPRTVQAFRGIPIRVTEILKGETAPT